MVTMTRSYYTHSLSMTSAMPLVLAVLVIGFLEAGNASLRFVGALSFETKPTVPTQPHNGAAAAGTKYKFSTKSKSKMFEYLKFESQGPPTFDVLAKTKEYIEQQQQDIDQIPEDIYDKDYVLRGAVIGPLTRKDLTSTQNGFDLKKAFDVDIETFGYTIDPENPYRCLYFQRWRAIHKGPLNVGGSIKEATMKEMEAPVSVFSVVWTPEQKIIYQQVGAVVDRFEGNTQGKAAVFGLLHTAGVKLPGGPGNNTFRFMQRLGHWLHRGRSFSREEDIPSWWTSKSRGADPTDDC